MSSFKEKLYLKSPYFVKCILVNISGYQNIKQRYNDDYLKYYENYLNLWEKELYEIIEFQKKELISLLQDAFLHSIWYNKKMVAQGINLELIKSDPYRALKTMPFLLKEELKNNLEEIVNKNRKIIGTGHTSGTTGSPTKYYYCLETLNRSFALWKRFHHTINLNKKEKQVRLSGRFIVHPDKKKPPFWIYNYSENQLLMSTYHLKNDNLPFYIDKLNRFKPALIDGYPTVIHVISKFINDNNINLTFKPKAVSVTAETLYDFQRKEIEKAFNCKVYNQYASSEGSPFITECLNGNLHVNIDSGVFEFINEKGEDAKPGEVAQMIVTSFRNLSTPLIRYKIRDSILLPKEPITCLCGCKMPVIKAVFGREDDILWTHERGYAIFDLFKEGLDNIEKSQLIQHTPSKITINTVVKGELTNKMRKILLSHLQERLGKKIQYTINVVDDIPLSANGKFMAVKRNFKIN